MIKVVRGSVRDKIVWLILFCSILAVLVKGRSLVEVQPIRTVSAMDLGRTSLTHRVRLVRALVLLKSRTKRIRERRICA